MYKPFKYVKIAFLIYINCREAHQKEAFAMISKDFFLTRIMMNMISLKEMHPILLFLFLPVNIRSPKS